MSRTDSSHHWGFWVIWIVLLGAAACVVLYPFPEDWPAWARLIRGALSEFQALIAGGLALVAGGLAFLGLKEQTAALRNQSEATARQHLQQIDSQNAQRRQEKELFDREQAFRVIATEQSDKARVVVVTRRLDRAISQVIVETHRLVDDVTKGAEQTEQNGKSWYRQNLSKYVLPSLMAAFEEFTNTCNWFYDQALIITPGRQLALITVVHASTQAVAHIKIPHYFVSQAIEENKEIDVPSTLLALPQAEVLILCNQVLKNIAVGSGEVIDPGVKTSIDSLLAFLHVLHEATASKHI